MKMRNLLLPFLVILLAGCQKRTEPIAGQNIFFDYELLGLDFEKRTSRVGFSLTNNSSIPLDKDWSIYFNQMIGLPATELHENGIEITRVQGDFWRLNPTQEFEALQPGDTRRIEWQARGLIVNVNSMPFTPFIRFGETEDGQLLDFRIQPIDEQLIPEDMRPTNLSRWEENDYGENLKSSVRKVLPSPAIYRELDSQLILRDVRICADQSLANELKWLEDVLVDEFNVSMREDGDCNIRLVVDERISGEESYQLVVSETEVLVEASEPSGIFYGLQSLVALVSPERLKSTEGPFVIPRVEIKDQPAFPYRGMHLDVSRNFHTVASVKKLLKIMAFYKLNKFHLHLTDDEGWRLEIPELPELTSVGARRGFDDQESDFIHPAYGSGPDPDDPGNNGSGFFSQKEMVDMLRFATERHIQVIPEIDLPGHARAAIKALESRFNRTGDERYRLVDPGDTSTYLSIQNYPDNVINVCQESTYDFINLVVDNLVKIYDQAGLQLEIVHVGADEVPKGVWQGSPKCLELIGKTADLERSDQLQRYFLYQVNEMLKAKNIRLAGWEEIVEGESGNDYQDLSMIPFVWHKADEAYRLANEGYEVVLCNATNLYFDLAYNRDPLEPGLHWAGYVDTKKAFDFMPFNYEVPFHENKAERSPRTILTKKGEQNILGIQGQLWSETILGSEMLEYYLMPKLIGLSERAWVGDPAWEGDNQTRIEDWSYFAKQVGERELPRLDYLFGGFNYRIPLPGISMSEGNVLVNQRFPGLAIHYTEDGEIPTVADKKYEEPIPYQENLVFRAFDTKGRGSREVRVNKSRL